MEDILYSSRKPLNYPRTSSMGMQSKRQRTNTIQSAVIDRTGAGGGLFQRVMAGVRPLAVAAAAQATGLSSSAINFGIDTAMDAASSGVQQATLSGAKRLVDQMTGAGEQDIDRDNINMPPAAIIPGRGAEVSIISKGFQPGSKLKIPGAGGKIHNAFAEQIKAWEPVTAKCSFAYKGLLNVQFSNNVNPKTRFYTHQFFRHASLFVNNSAHADNTLLWNNTLGPDASFTRKTPANGGSAYGTVTGVTTELRTPYRFPPAGSYQAIRLTRNMLENIGWNANPYKHVTATSSTLSTSLVQTTPAVYADASLYTVDSASNAIKSLPSQQPNNLDTTQPLSATSCYYRSQFGNGLVNYQFCNDGTTPVVCDVVITKLKKGEVVGDPATYVTNLETTYKQGYLNMCLGNRGVVDLEGAGIQMADVFDNSKVEFMPEKALRYYNKAATNEPRPFVHVVRDQFIIDAGSVKPYEFKMPPINYYAPDYDAVNSFIDDLTYCVSIAFSTLSTPVIEAITGGGSAIIDRRGNSLNVSVTGTYTERCHPVYLSEFNNNWYTNGILNTPVYTTGTPTLTRSTVIPPEMSTRSSAQSSAYIDTGASNTLSGA